MNIAVIFAGGTGTRMNSKEKPKQFLRMHDKPIIIHTLEKFQNNENIDAIVIACIKEWINYLSYLIDYYHISKVKKIVPGGETGQMSIYAGLNAAKEISYDNNAVVLIHDGVRPLINNDVINDNIESVIHNAYMLERFICVSGIEPNTQLIDKLFKELILFTAKAA